MLAIVTPGWIASIGPISAAAMETALINPSGSNGLKRRARSLASIASSGWLRNARMFPLAIQALAAFVATTR